MAICCGGKKQKVFHSVTSSIANRCLSEKHNGINGHYQQQQQQNFKSNSPKHQRSHSQINHRQTKSKHLPMPHDLTRSSANSASSSALTYAYGTPQNSSHVNNHHKNINKMDMSDDDADLNDNKPNGTCSLTTSNKHSIIHADMVFYCFEILGNYLFNGKHHSGRNHSFASNGQTSSSPVVPPVLPSESYPLFVTWLIGSEQKLRGCIGTFTPMNLTHGLREYAITSAVNDSRFSPISRDEYPHLSCAVSILTNFEPCSSYLDWNIGIHGIRIEFFNERGAKRSATYLPEVAHEQGWNHTQTLDSLLRKGGYKATITADMRKSVQVTRYQSEKITLHYTDYIKSKGNSPMTMTTATTMRQKF